MRLLTQRVDEEIRRVAAIHARGPAVTLYDAGFENGVLYALGWVRAPWVYHAPHELCAERRERPRPNTIDLFEEAAG